MSVIYYNFTNATNLGPLVAGPAPGGGWIQAQNHLPAAQAIHVIANFHTSNFYAWIAGGLNNRFSKRHEAACVFGFDQPTMRQIGLWYGTVQVYNTLPPPPPPNLVLNAGVHPAMPAPRSAALERSCTA